MRTFSELHFDAIGEIINIATGRAAEGLGAVIGEAVQSSVPSVDILKSIDVTADSLRLNDKKFGVVTQEITGVINAEVMLIFAEENVLRIIRNMMGGELSIDVIREFESEAMCELGNIMINACVSSIADMLKTPIESSLPCYSIQSCDELVESVKSAKLPDFVLASHVDLSIESNPTEGKLFFLIDTISLERIISEINKLTT